MNYQDFITATSLKVPGGGTAPTGEDSIYYIVGPTGATGPGVIVSDTVPSITSEGQIWFNSLDGDVYMAYTGVYISISA